MMMGRAALKELRRPPPRNYGLMTLVLVQIVILYTFHRPVCVCDNRHTREAGVIPQPISFVTS